MNEVDRERADILRAELARLCWLIAHDDTGDERTKHLLQERLNTARQAGTRSFGGGLPDQSEGA